MLMDNTIMQTITRKKIRLNFFMFLEPFSGKPEPMGFERTIFPENTVFRLL